MEVLEEVELKHVFVSLLENDVIKLRVKEHSIIDIDDVKEVQGAKRTLIGDKKHTVLFVTPKLGLITREARDYSKAVVLNGLAMRIIVNFFINFNKPPVEHKIFENEEEALNWIQTLK